MKQLQDETIAILEPLGRLLRELTRQTGGADDGPPMTATQRIALIELIDHGPTRLNALADRLGVSAPTASRTVDALACLGLVERLPDPDDRRALRIELTPAGAQLVAHRKQRAAEAFGPAAATLSERERTTLIALLERMTAAL